MALFIISILSVLVFATLAHLFLRNRISFTESLIQCGAATVIGMVVIGFMYFRDMSDFAIVNGHVESKAKVKVSCEHSYRCNCYTTCTGSGDNRSCTEHCSTCYEHSHDFDWDVKTTVGLITIDRINRQGTQEPPRWTAVIPGEPASNTVSYVNYIKAAPDSLFSMKANEEMDKQFAPLFPKYPKVFDYYRYNRIHQMGVVYPQATQLNDRLNRSLGVIGPKKQVNIQVVFVNTPNEQYRYALERNWIGGKKNDVIVVIGVTPKMELLWSDTITFGRNAGNEMLAVKLRDAIRNTAKNQQLGNAEVLGAVIAGSVNNDFKRKSMEDFAYLKEDYKLSEGALLGYIIFQLVLLTGTTIFFYYYDMETGDWHSNKGRIRVYR